MMVAQTSSWEGRIVTATMAALQAKAALLGLRAEQASQASLEALSAEVIRVALWVQSVYKQPSSFSGAAVTTRNLLEVARTLWTPIQDVYLESSSNSKMHHSNGQQEVEGESKLPVEIGRDLLDDLTEQGDLCYLGEGRWLPAPLRLVPLSQTYFLLVGGMPTYLLPDDLRRVLRLHGSFRHVDVSEISALKSGQEHPLQWQFQSLEGWLGPSPQTLDDLAHFFDQQELQPITHQSVSNTSFEAYDASIDKPQYVRWQSLDHVVDGRYLLRDRTPWGAKQYSIGYVSDRRLTKQSHVLHHIDIRRLCYALDAQAGKPTRAIWDPKHGQLILHSELPGRGRKLLSSIGFLQESHESYYPRRWVGIGPNHAHTVESLLTELGIRIDIM